MRKIQLISAVLAAAALLAAGCGKSSKPAVPADPTPAPETQEEGELVQMEKAEKPLEAEKDYEHMIGTKTQTSSVLLITNKTGDEIATIYIRPTVTNAMTDDWGDELVKGSFTLKDGEETAFCFEKDRKDNAGNLVTNYDIRIGYTDIYKNECFFRNLPLTVMKDLSLCMEGTGLNGIPYAKYHSTAGDTEYSTLEEVKKRLGLTTTTAITGSSLLSPSPTPAPAATQQPEDTPAETQPVDTPVPVPQETTPVVVPDSGAASASAYIGQSLDSLIGAMGSPTGSEYVDEPETGRTGYHYYSTFTVSTIVDDAGNETVAGVW